LWLVLIGRREEEEEEESEVAVVCVVWANVRQAGAAGLERVIQDGLIIVVLHI
jgi:hypothetical protein